MYQISLPELEKRDSQQFGTNVDNTIVLDSLIADPNNTLGLPLVDKVSDKRANVDYLYYSDQDGDEDIEAGTAQNRSQSMGNMIFTATDRSAMKVYARWNE